MTPLARTIVFGLTIVIAVLAGALVHQQKTILQLRKDMSSLRHQADQAAAMAHETARFSNLLVVARAAQPLPVDPSSELLRLRGQIGLLQHELQQARSTTNLEISGSDRALDAERSGEALRTIAGHQIEIERELARTTAMSEAFQQLRAVGMEELRHGIIETGSDSLLARFSEELAVAEQALEAAQSQRNPQQAEVQRCRAEVEDLNRKMDERAEGVLLGLRIKTESEKNVLEQLQAEAQRIREGAEQRSN